MASQGVAANSRLNQMQMRFQQKQMQEREQRRIEMTGGVGASSESNVAGKSIGNGKVRQMFDDRRRGVGIDRSHPLKPIATKTSQSSIDLTTRNRRVVPIAPAKQQGNRTMIRSETYHHNISRNGNSEHSFDELDTWSSESFPKEFGSMTLNESRTGDKNNNQSQYPPNSYMRPSNSGKLNPVLTKKSPNTVSRGATGNGTPIARQNGKGPMRSTVVRAENVMKTPSPPKTNVRNSKPPSRTSNSTPKMTTPSQKTQTRPNAQTSPAPAGMAKCKFCQRNFNTDRLQKHETVCEKMMNRKRKIFDASKHRVAGTEAEKYQGKPPAKAKAAVATRGSSYSTAAQPLAPPKNNWRKKHEEFINAIRDAKKVQIHLAKGGKLSDLPPPPPSDTSDYIQCPHCSRRFNQTAAERHIPKCATMLHNKPKAGSKK